MATKDTPQAHIESASEAAEIAKQKAEEALKVAAAEAKAKEVAQAAEEQTDTKLSQKQAVPQAEASATEAVQNSASSKPLQRFQTWLKETFPGNENAVLGGVAGLIVACLFFAIGFARTLFIVVLVLAGVALGQIADGDPKLIRAIQKFIKKH